MKDTIPPKVLSGGMSLRGLKDSLEFLCAFSYSDNSKCFQIQKKRSGLISSIKSRNIISCFSCSRHVLAQVDGLSGKELVSTNWG